MLAACLSLPIQAQPLAKDPTRPADRQPKDHSEAAEGKIAASWVLQAVTYTRQHQSAIINGHHYRAGQWLNKQVKLHQVLPDSVILVVNDKKQTLTLRDIKIKTEVNGAFN